MITRARNTPILLWLQVAAVASRQTIVDMSEVIAGIKRLHGAKEPVARAMGYAMGVEVRDAAKMLVPVGTDIDGSKRPGLLKSAIYNAYDDHANVLGADNFTYVVSWNRKKAPHGHLVEFGHWMPYQYRTDYHGSFWTVPIPQKRGPKWVSARPFLGPAYEMTKTTLFGIAVAAGKKRFQEYMA